MGKCCIPDCSSQYTKGLHVFPANQKIRREWVRWTKTFHLSPKELSKKTVCDAHFNIDDRYIDMNGKKCVRTDAIPCMLLPSNLTFKSEHNYAFDSNSGSIRKRQTPRAMSKKKVAAMTKAIFEAILENDPTVTNVGSEVMIDNKVSDSSQEQVNLNALDMLREATARIKMLEGKLLEKDKVIEAMRKNSKNGKKLKHLRQILKNNKRSDAIVIKYLEDKNFNDQQLDFLKMQIKNINKKVVNAYRYTDEQKNLALAIYKQSPKSYRFMQRIFILPCKRTLGRHSAKLIFESGVDPKFFQFLKENVKNMSIIDTYCTIAWDEMALKSNLDYNATTDSIDGFVELADQRRPEFATHSLTFMVRGINTPYKQTVAFFYTDGLKSIELAALIKLVTEAVLETGLQVIGSTCDQVGTNVAAVHILIYEDFISRSSDGRLLKYVIRGRTIFHCYDPPHLIKVLRNNLLTKDLKHFVSKRWNISSSHAIDEKKPKVASWKHVCALYRKDIKGCYRRLLKITNEHISPDKLKMKVSVATQVFSATFGQVMIESCNKKQSSDEFIGTAEILLFFNDLFDSINGSNQPQNKTLKGSVNESSLHFAFWDYALAMLAKMDFITRNTGDVNNASTVLKKFESTIRGYAEIAVICLNAKVTNVSIRNTNQDGLERSFGCIKSCSQNPKAPIPMHFRTSYATMNVNNITDSNSLATNCEEDSTVSLLNNLHAFCLNYKQDRGATSVKNSNQSHIDCDQNDLIEIISFDSEFQVDHNQNDTFEAVVFDPQFGESEVITENETLSFVLNSILKKLLKVTACKTCRKSVEMYDNISYPLGILESFNKIFYKVKAMIPHLCFEKSLQKTLLTHIDDVDVNVGCPEHYVDVSLNFKKIFTNHAILLFCRNINSILSGKTTIQDSQNLHDLNDIEYQAYQFRLKKKRIGKYTDKFTK